MKKILAFVIGILFSSVSFAQTANENDLITAYLLINNIPWSPSDWSTCAIGNGPVLVCGWNATNLGTQPSQTVLTTYNTAALNLEQARNFQNIIFNGVTVVCATGDVICSPSLEATYNLQQADLVQIGLEWLSLTHDGTFSGGGISLVLSDAFGGTHAFSTQQFLEYADAVETYYSGMVSAYETFLTGASASYPTFAPLTSVGIPALPAANQVSLTNSSGIQTYSPSLPWSMVSGTPTTRAGYGISDAAPKPLTGSVSITGGSLLLGGCLTTATATVTGAASGNVVVATPAADPGAWIANAWVSAANTVSLRVCAGVAETLSTQTWNIRVIP
jgi:hypothetical protein